VTELAAGATELTAGGPWTSIGARGFAAGRFGAAAMAAEYGIAEYGTRARDGIAVAVQLLAAGLVLGPRAVPDAIGRCRDLLSARVPPGQDGDLRDALAILLAMSGRYESARDALAVRSGPGAAGGSGGRVAAAAVEHLAGRWDAVGPALRGARDRPASGLPAAGLPPRGLNLLARSLLAQGRIDAADDLLRRGGAGAIGAGVIGVGAIGAGALGPATLGDRCGIAARVLAARGRAACALLLAHSAVATAERTDSTGGQGLASLDLAHTYLALGDGRAARAAAMNARRSFVRKEHLVGIARADQLLSATSG
jgi:hypothetical protein